MKTRYQLLLLLLASLVAHSQEVINRKYLWEQKTITFKVGTTGTRHVLKDTVIDRTALAKRSAMESFRGEKVFYLAFDEAVLNDATFKANSTFSGDKLKLTLKPGVYNVRYLILPQKELTKDGKAIGAEVVLPDTKEDLYCYIKFDEDGKAWVNPWLDGTYDDRGVVFYQLANRQTITFRFSEVTVSALTIPFKYRPKHSGYAEDFSTAVNLNVMVEITPFLWGKTSYHYRSKVGNVTTTRRVTVGPIFGVSTVSLDAGNTSASADPIKGSDKITKGLITAGGGLVYSRNKLSFGALAGWDWAAGDNAGRWNYNGNLWVGLAVGYSLFAFAQ
ncbi:MAG: hypothetical protein ACRYFV_09860 [Janthinobacterium lividum]